MAHKKKKKSKEKKDAKKEKVSFSLFDTLSPHTLRGIVGVFLFVFSALLLLSLIGGAGRFGNFVFSSLFGLFGIGYFLSPFLLIIWALSLFSIENEEKTSFFTPLGFIGSTLLLFSLLAGVSLWFPHYGGLIGSFLAHYSVIYLDTIASTVLYFGLFLISLFILFGSEWTLFLKKKLFSLFASFKKEKGPDAEEEEKLALTALETHNDYEEEQEEKNDPYETKEDEDGVSFKDAPPPSPSSFKEKKEESPLVKKTSPAHQVSPEYVAPPLPLLELDRGKPNVGDTKAQANIIRRTLQHFKIAVEMDEIVVGPTVTRYSLKPAEGVRLNKIVALQSNLELALAASPIRIEAPIPGKSLVGIEVPNTGKAIVGLGGLLSSPLFSAESAPLFTALGKDIAGNAHYGNISKMPHALVAGTTGSGKSVMVHSIITSLLYRNGPEQLRFIMVDPKRVELTLYNGIPHLLTPVITDAKKCILSLKWATKEMERRYEVLQENAVQGIGGYHQDIYAPAKAHFERMKEKGKDVSDYEMPEAMPHILILIDELADIMSSYPRELEALIVRLAQMSRAVGIHLVLSTQRPSVNVITGLIKANIPTRIALKVASLIDSRTILDQPGAEKLLGAGDMLYLAGDMSKPMRIQSPFLTTKEVKQVVKFIIDNNKDIAPLAPIEMSTESASTATVSTGENSLAGSGGGMFDIPFDESSDDADPLYEDIKALVYKEERVSVSLLQRRFRLGYGRAARIVDQLETDGILASADGGNKGRQVLRRGNEENATMREEKENTDTDEGENNKEKDYHKNYFFTSCSYCGRVWNF